MPKRGFTLIELLVVIAIIGVISAVVLASLNGSRGRARDAQRKSDLKQMSIAIEHYHSDRGTYVIPGTGWNGTSEGWYNNENPANSYPKSIDRGLRELGYLPAPIRDPQLPPSNSGNQQYMKYQCGTGFYVYARLEYPSSNDLAAYAASKAQGCANLDAYNMNYALGHR
jgi:prepilin-type N-terminal cleavage/methylation domain-containing protein